jgi:hypothetical protein
MQPAAWTDKLERLLGNWAVPCLTRGIVVLTLLTYILNGISPGFTSMLMLDSEAVWRGEVWRLLTFIIVPDTTGVLWVFISLFFTWFVGDALESEWGSFKVNLYVFTSVIALGVLSLFLAKGRFDNVFFYSSFLLAFATVFPKLELMLFPLPIPIKAAYLGYFNGALILIHVLLVPSVLFFVLASLANYLLFFVPGFLEMLRYRLKRRG